MKYLLLIIVIGLVFFMLGFKGARPRVPPGGSRRSGPAPSPPPPRGASQMVACAHCGLHLPADEALPGRGGMFCCAEHRAAYEASHAP